MEIHPLQLDTACSSGSLHTLSAVNTDLKKGSRDPDTLTVGAGSHGACLTLNDHDNIRQFVQEFTFRGLLPHIEKNIRQLNDQVPLLYLVEKTTLLLLYSEERLLFDCVVTFEILVYVALGNVSILKMCCFACTLP